LRSVISCFAVDAEDTLACGQQALAKTPRELWIVRVAARQSCSKALGEDCTLRNPRQVVTFTLS
jgi:hypothetical protein